MPATNPSPRWTLEMVLLAAVILCVAGLRLYYDISAPPMGDEAYYWMWGQRPGWSYFDHPPLDAWLQGGIAALFGWSTVSLRLLTWASLAGTLALLWIWARRLAPGRPLGTFLPMAAILLTVPVVALFTFEAFHDHLLVFFAVLALYALWRFAEAWEQTGRGIGWLYLAGLAIGLATLSKYNGALLGVGSFALFAFHRPLWGALRTPHPWLAALLALALQGPVIYWNLTEGFATLSYHFVERPANHWGHPAIGQGFGFLLQALVASGPLLLLAALRYPWLRDPIARRLRPVTAAVFLGSTAIVLMAALYTDVLLHWNIIAYVALALAGPWLLGRWLIWPQLLIGLYATAMAIASYAGLPTNLPGFRDPTIPSNFGWDAVAAAVRDAEAANPGAFLAATRYTYAAQLGFALQDPGVTAINPLRSQYDFWWSPDAHVGQNAVIVADASNPISLASARFVSVSKLAEVPVITGGRQVWSFDIYLGHGYRAR
jgi:4-amino-4-deoxy-L-arabinose transferase-like glycosyltransferase